mgnify:CR=1 FL=1
MTTAELLGQYDRELKANIERQHALARRAEVLRTAITRLRVGEDARIVLARVEASER